MGTSQEKKKRELAKWQGVAKKGVPSYYLVMMVVIVALVYIVDELTSNITSTVQSAVVNDFFVSQGIDFNT